MGVDYEQGEEDGLESNVQITCAGVCNMQSSIEIHSDAPLRILVGISKHGDATFISRASVSRDRNRD